MKRLLAFGIPLFIATLVAPALAADVPITGLKLIVLDKTVVGQAKVVFVSKDPGITKGAGTDPADISAELGLAFDASTGTFLMPQGVNWIVNKDTVAKYVNKTAPTGGATKVNAIKPGLLIKAVGKSLGDSAIDISLAPTGNVYVAYSVVNAGVETRHCTTFSGCAHQSIAGGTGYKLVCTTGGSGDPLCLGASEPTCCEFPEGPTCSFTPSPLLCQNVGGTPGASGSSCDSVSGTCTLAAPGAGGCCDGLMAPFGPVCLAGPAVTAGSCSDNFVASGVCTVAGTCS